MNSWEAIEKRHSVRQYLTRPIEAEKRQVLDQLAEQCSRDSGLRFEVFYDEPKCFASPKAGVMKFKGCENYITISGKRDEDKELECGYYGEKMVLEAQKLGLNTCWVALTHGKTQVSLTQYEKLIIVISLGYGENQGRQADSKSIQDLCNYSTDMPEWFLEGMRSARLAPTARHQQKFFFTLKDEEVYAKSYKALCHRIDLGIVKYHFELVTGKKVIIED